MLVESGKPVRALAARPEDAQRDKDRSHRESNATHTERIVGPMTSGRSRARPSDTGTLEAGLYLQAGETIRPVQVDADRAATSRQADTPQAALEFAQQASRLLRVEVARYDCAQAHRGSAPRARFSRDDLPR